MTADFLFDRFREFGDTDAIVWQNRSFSFRWLLEATHSWQRKVSEFGIEPGNVVVLEGDFSPNAVALFLALIQNACMVVPLTSSLTQNEGTLQETAQCEYATHISQNDHVEMERLPHRASHEHYLQLIKLGHPGLILFSSGSTGPSKAALHDMNRILQKFLTPRKAFRSISFLLYDHIGGINTMLYLLTNGGCLVTVGDRSPDTVLNSIEKHRVELLPTSPTFINLILLIFNCFH